LKALHLGKNLIEAGLLSLIILLLSFILTWLSALPSLSPVDLNGCSYPASYGLPLPFVLYRTQFDQNFGCSGYFVTVDYLNLVIDFALWLFLGLLIFLGLEMLRMRNRPPLGRKNLSQFPSTQNRPVSTLKISCSATVIGLARPKTRK
jgi:hypothetical protein